MSTSGVYFSSGSAYWSARRCDPSLHSSSSSDDSSDEDKKVSKKSKEILENPNQMTESEQKYLQRLQNTPMTKKERKRRIDKVNMKIDSLSECSERHRQMRKLIALTDNSFTELFCVIL